MAAEPAWLVATGEDGERRYIRLDLSVTTIGRNEGNVVDLIDKRLSRFHCEIHRRGDAYVLRDCGSRNGTAVNGTRVASEITLAEGDRVELGNSKLVFRVKRPAEVGPRDLAQPLPVGPMSRRPILDLSGN